jgi:hypothetical protein
MDKVKSDVFDAIPSNISPTIVTSFAALVVEIITIQDAQKISWR